MSIPTCLARLETLMRHARTARTIRGVVAAAAAGLAIAASGQSTDRPFTVEVINNTATPAQGDDHPQGHLQIECGLDVWRSITKSSNKHSIDCYPSWNADPFDLTYKARLANDANGNPVYHTGTVTFNCYRTAASTLAASPPATHAEVTLMGSGTAITASNTACHYPPPPID